MQFDPACVIDRENGGQREEETYKYSGRMSGVSVISGWMAKTMKVIHVFPHSPHHHGHSLYIGDSG